MISPFGTSFRRNPDDPRGLVEQIDDLVRERLEEAVELVCLDLLVQLRRQHGRPLPEAQNGNDREEFRLLVRDFLVRLRNAHLTGLSQAEQGVVLQAEAGAGRDEPQRLIAGQVALAKRLPDYWQRFETLRLAFVQERLAAPPAKPSLRDRLLGR